MTPALFFQKPKCQISGMMMMCCWNGKYLALESAWAVILISIAWWNDQWRLNEAAMIGTRFYGANNIAGKISGNTGVVGWESVGVRDETLTRGVLKLVRWTKWISERCREERASRRTVEWVRRTGCKYDGLALKLFYFTCTIKGWRGILRSLVFRGEYLAVHTADWAGKSKGGDWM